MIYLVLSVLCTAAFILLFKVFEKYAIQTFDAIVFNYWVAFGCGVFFVPKNTFGDIAHANWLWFAFVLGAGFITVFTLTGETVRLFSVSAASVSMKLGLVFPVIFAFLIYEEPYNSLKLIGILFAFVAVILSTYRHLDEHHKHAKLQMLFPFIVFAGSGLCDSGVQYANKVLLGSSDIIPFVTMNFFTAATFGSTVLAYRFISRETKFKWRNVAGGIAVGIPNYFSFVFMLKSLETMNWGSSVVFPVSNLSTIACSAFAAFIFFKEKISKINLLGLIFAVVAIVLIIVSNNS